MGINSNRQWRIVCNAWLIAIPPMVLFCLAFDPPVSNVLNVTMAGIGLAVAKLMDDDDEGGKRKRAKNRRRAFCPAQ